ncbi:MAG: RIP metalloprotease RseP [Acidobacteria bacterium]|nr:RIP metalloprotease RseP [Acidobacteriota bacterium]
MDTLIAIFSFVIILGVIIFLHELGHFIAARLFRIRVETFSLGFGKRLWGFEKNGVDYRISMIPLGGYVKMAGEYFGESRGGDPDEFLSKPRYQRAIVSFAGPFMNFLLAVFLLTANNVIGVDMPGFTREPARVGDIVAGSPAAAADLEVGDEIIRLGNDAVTDWQDFQLEAISAANETVALEIRRHGRLMQTEIRIGEDLQDPYNISGIKPFVPARIQQVAPDYPAAAAGLQSGDVIAWVSHDNESASGYFHIFRFIWNRPGKKLTLQVQRGERTLEKVVYSAAEVVSVPEGSPAQGMGLQVGDIIQSLTRDDRVADHFPEIVQWLHEDWSPTMSLVVLRKSKPVTLDVPPTAADTLSAALVHPEQAEPESTFMVRGVLGFSFDFAFYKEQYPLPQALVKSFRDNYELVLLTYRILGKVLTAELSLKQFQGPIGIAQATGEVVKTGKWTNIFAFSALISINLAILNLLPIPVLDGGMLLLLLIEMGLRRDLPLRLKERIIQIGFLILITFMAVVVMLDIMKSFGGT